ncbi:hypothetical protein ABGB18_11425 [Nonomuraea sp. B12E4]
MLESPGGVGEREWSRRLGAAAGESLPPALARSRYERRERHPIHLECRGR